MTAAPRHGGRRAELAGRRRNRTAARRPAGSPSIRESPAALRGLVHGERIFQVRGPREALAAAAFRIGHGLRRRSDGRPRRPHDLCLDLSQRRRHLEELRLRGDVHAHRPRPRRPCRRVPRLERPRDRRRSAQPRDRLPRRRQRRLALAGCRRELGQRPRDSNTQVAVDPTDSSIVYATGQSGVYKSTDGGDSFVLKFES